MSDYDHAPREYRSPPLSDIQNAIPERKVWTRDAISPQEVILARRIKARAEGDMVDLDKRAFWRGFSWGVIAALISSGVLTVLWYLLTVQQPGAY